MTAAAPAVAASGPLAGPGPASLYVHVPFCESKCSYCDFYSVPQGGVSESRYVEALAAEAASRAPAEFAPRTVFVGGGTPTALDDADFVRLLELVRGLVMPGGELVEWTIEANPGSLTVTKAREMAAAGVTRISLGVQSFDGNFETLKGKLQKLYGYSKERASTELDEAIQKMKSKG